MMTRWMRENRMSFSYFPVCLVLWATGCSQADLSDYKATGKHGNSTPKNRSASSTPSELGPNVPSFAVPTELPVTSVEPPPNVLEIASISALTPVNVEIVTEVRTVGYGVSPIVDDRVEAGAGPLPVSADPLPIATVEKTAESAEPRKIEILIKDKTFRTDRKTGAVLVTFDDLDLEKVLNMTEVSENVEELMPDWLTKLQGQTVRVRGYMVPTYVADGIEQFVLAKDNQNCCFGPNPRIDYLAQVNLKQGKTTNYIPVTRAFDVVGKFQIHAEAYEGKLLSLYFIEDAEIIDR